jgi:hypothetical protein
VGSPLKSHFCAFLKFIISGGIWLEMNFISVPEEL